MTMIEKAEQAAKEYLASYDSAVYFRDDGDTCLIDGHVNMTALVRAVIQAMREPSDAMIRPSNDYTDRLHNKTLWQTMIDAELSKSQ